MKYHQFFSTVNVASDHNALSMEVMHKIAVKNGLAVIFHDKPFKGLNGSGKHNNWGLNTEDGSNLFKPGKTKYEQERFMTFLAALIYAVYVHGDVLRIGVATPGNDHRLGAHEAPPAVISMYTGYILERHIDSVINGGELAGYGLQTTELDFGTKFVHKLQKPIEDRNRTSPFPYCGNRFEFRAVGSGQDIAFPLTILNAAMSDGMNYISNLMEKGVSQKEAVIQTFKKYKNCINNGNNYDPKWPAEAVKRGLFNFPQSVDALQHFDSKKNIDLFKNTKIFTEHELKARKNILLEQFIQQILLEANTVMMMIYTGVVPCVIQTFDLKFEDKTLESYMKLRKTLLSQTCERTNILNEIIKKLPDSDLQTQALYCQNQIRPQMRAVRETCDQLEAISDSHNWPYPSYLELIYDHHLQGEDETSLNKTGLHYL